jgi:hypothetical protein
MPTDITISTDKPFNGTSGLIAVTSGTAYTTTEPTTTAPSTTGQNFLIPTNLGDKPSLLRLQPFCGANTAPTSATFASGGLRVVGWSIYTQTSGTAIYIPTVLADLTLGLTTGTVQSETVNGSVQYPFSTVSAGVGVPTVNVYSPGTASTANVEPCAALIDTIGLQFVQLQFKATASVSTPTMGAFYAFL